MNSEKWKEIKQIFNQAVELDSPHREAFLEQQTSPEVLDEVRQLLEAEKQDNFVQPLANLSPIWPEEIDGNFVGQEIDGYKISKEIGSGGMGIVFEAVREKDGFSQTVALKLLKKGMDSDAMLRRFHHERQILASLEHPHIGRLLDGGRSHEGTPFFAMEFVKGEPIDEFCNKRDLNIHQRLRLFLQVCAAVSFAHSRLVVHRDLKPSNILVTADGTVKLLDFGIAKIVSADKDLRTQTVTSLGMMTPKYASPEQIGGQIVSTSSDIYSLGLILYELLTGVPAYNFPSNRPDEIAKIICESEPLRPSSVVSSPSRAEENNTSNNKGPRTKDDGQPTNPKSKVQNPKSLRGDLDNIILKALNKNPARRYASVEQFASDIERHLNGLPVIARPDTLSYRLEKFVKRNRVYVMTGTLLFLTLIAGIAATTWQAYRAEQQRKLADERFRQVRELANNIVFKYYDAAEKLPNSTPMREMFVKDSLDYLDSLARDVNADDLLKSELGKAYLRIARVQGRPFSPNLGQTAGALENYRKGIEILEPLMLKTNDANLQSDFISAHSDYAVVLKQNGNPDEADKVFQKAISFGEDSLRQQPNSENLASRLALNYMFWGDSLPLGTAENENIYIYQKALRTYENLLKNNPDDLRLNNYAVASRDRISLALMTLARSARFDENQSLEKQYLQEAKPLLEKNVEVSDKMVRLYPDQILPPAMLASAELSYGTLLIALEDYPKALETVQKAEKFYRASLEADQVSVGQKLEVSTIEQRLGTIYFRTGKVAQAEKLFIHAFELLDYLVEKDPNNFDYLKVRGEAVFEYADELVRIGKIEKARQIYEKAFDQMFEPAQNKDADYAKSIQALYFEKLGHCFLAEKSSAKAVIEYRNAIEIWESGSVLNLAGIRQHEKLEVLQRKVQQLTQ